MIGISDICNAFRVLEFTVSNLNIQVEGLSGFSDVQGLGVSGFAGLGLRDPVRAGHCHITSDLHAAWPRFEAWLWPENPIFFRGS